MVYCSGLENLAGKPQETAENAEICALGDAPEAMFAEGSASSVGLQVGTVWAMSGQHLSEDDWCWYRPIGNRAVFALDRFDAFLAKCGYLNGRPGIPPRIAVDDYMTDEMWQRIGRANHEYTYFARGQQSGLIKIGMSKDPEFRVRNLRWDKTHPERADMLVYRKWNLERAYHNAFDTWRFEGEWFAPHPDILAEIARLQPLQSVTR